MDILFQVYNIMALIYILVCIQGLSRKIPPINASVPHTTWLDARVLQNDH